MGLNLVTLEEFKAYRGLTSPNQDDAINAIIPKVSALVKTICERSFVDDIDEPIVEIQTGGFPSIIPKQYPIISIDTFEVSNDYGNTYTELVEFEDYALDLDEGALVPIKASGYSGAHNAPSRQHSNPVIFPRIPNGYRITYTAGYEIIPQDLKLAVLDLIDYYLKHDMSVHSNKAPGTNAVQIEFISSTKLPAHIARILDYYVASVN